MALKPQNDREMKGLKDSNPPFSADQSRTLWILRSDRRNCPVCGLFARF
jgi:hypothetical protein